MKKPNLVGLARTISVAAKRRSPEILTVLGIAGMLTTTIMAVKATPRAILILNEEECLRSKKDESPEHITFVDKTRLTWKCYIPSTIIGAMSISSLVCASSVSARRHAALATAYTLSESVLKEYQEKVIETFGDKKERLVRESIAKDTLDKNPLGDRSVVITNKGDTLCYDAISGRYFKFEVDRLKKIENDLYRRLLSESYISLNDFYYEVGLANIPLGDDLGWNIDYGKFEICFSAQLAEHDEPCLVINYRIEPKYDYYKNK